MTVSADSPVTNFWYRAANGNKILPLNNGWYSVDDRWSTRISAGRLREVGGKAELLVPVELKDGKVSLFQTYAW